MNTKPTKVLSLVVILCMLFVFSLQAAETNTNAVSQKAETPLAQKIDKPSAEAAEKDFFDKIDTNKDEKLSKEEIMQSMKKYLEGADANKDGFVTREEIKNWRKGKAEINRKKMFEKKI